MNSSRLLGSKIGTTVTPAPNVGPSGIDADHAWVEGRGGLKPVAGRNLGKACSELLGDPHAKGTSLAATHATEVASSADDASRVTTHPLKPDSGNPY